METGALLSSDLMGSTGWFNPSYGIQAADASFSSAGSANAASRVCPVTSAALQSPVQSTMKPRAPCSPRSPNLPQHRRSSQIFLLLYLAYGDLSGHQRVFSSPWVTVLSFRNSL